VWFLNKPLTADQLYDRITTRAANANPEALAELAPLTKDFLGRFPEEPRKAEIESIAQTIDLDRLERRLRMRLKLGGAGANLTAEEAAYLTAMSVKELNPELALRRLKALVDVYQTGSNSGEAGQKCIELARRQIKEIENQMKSLAGAHSEAVEEQLRQADRLAKDAGSRARAVAIWKGVIDLYESQPWAAKHVAEAKERLAK
jgi:hypothetical protein